MAKPPAEVSFPGDKNRRRKVRVRGIKKASKQIQQRLDRNLEALLENPEAFLPDIDCELGKPRRDMLAATIKNIDAVSKKRHDRRWLTKRMTKRRGDVVCRALAGSLLAAGEADTSTVSVYNSPIYGASSFIRRGNGKQSHMVGIQNFTHSRLRLLVWDDHAKAGWWFFSWDGGFVCSGQEAKAPAEWIDDSLDGSTIDLSGDEVRWSKGLEKEIVEKGEFTDSGWLRLEIGEVIVGLTGAALAKTGNEPFVPSIALAMMPPKISAIAEAEWMWRPAGWPVERELPEAGRERLDEVLLAWMNLALPDDKLARSARDAILGTIEEGYIAGNHWFATDARDDFLAYLQGSEEEREALNIVLDSMEGGAMVRADGVVLESENDVIRFEDSACHPVLVALWEENGLDILESMFGLVGEEAEELYSKQARRKQGFGAFLRELKGSVSSARRLERLPWEEGVLPGPLDFAEALIRKAAEDGIASTVAMCRKAKGLDSAMGWAWLVVHERTESDAWRFDESSRDKGGDWVPAMTALWDAADSLLNKDILDAKEDYVNSMKWLAEVSGSSFTGQ
ncbi:MAG: hypothetical protein QGI58_02745 [Candidatus Thalassarchaeaceae archaeon]|jgi:hypothetical protein|nr:hypothetical protein [Candidatus Thalassarchaeaceae archaeon]